MSRRNKHLQTAVMGQALMARIVQQQAEQSVSAAAAEAGVPSNPDAAWWLKLLARGVGVVGAAGCHQYSVLYLIVVYTVFAIFAKNK